MAGVVGVERATTSPIRTLLSLSKSHKHGKRMRVLLPVQPGTE